ncbi:MAG TPA: penicillin-binding transpeptidase domain-containing protein [Thermoanaerobaculia bacterium]|nr:penicillin-binding transpeptidase domain-containing protein [Thermoanaerobaculia bacterium]
MRSRLAVISLAGLSWVALIGLRLYQLQVVDHLRYVRKAHQQQQRVVRLDPPRGTIYDAAGRELAVSVEVDSAYAVPGEIGDRAAAARAIAAACPGLAAGRLEALLGEDREFVWVARKLDPPVAAALRRLHLAGIHFVPESKRYYPMRDLASQVLGYVGTDNHGLAGLELIYDAVITGKPGLRTVLRDARRGTAVSPDLFFTEPRPGGDLHLTLDAAVQHMVERELQRVVEQRQARRGSAVFLDPATGAVLAMASFPAFDPNEFERYPAGSWRNRTIMDAYEPGSTFKIITAAAALESGLVHADDPFDCGMGSIVLYGITIRDHKRYGIMSFADVIAKSSNVGAIRAALIIGGERLHRTIVGFGFGRPTGIDLPGESPGILHPLERWGPLTKAYVAFGQGVSVTPLQLAAAVAAVANGGSLLQPYVVEAVRRGETVERRHPQPAVMARPISPATAEEVKRLLERVVTDGTGKSAAVAGYRVAGKTGTAQIPVAGGYARHAYLPSFVGFAPADRPSLVGIVEVDAPQGMEYYGAQVAAPVFGTLVRQVLMYLGVRPQRQALSVWPGEVVTAGVTTANAAGGGAAASAGVVPAAARGAVTPAAAGVVAAADDDAMGEDVPELWHNQPVPPRTAPAAPGAPAAPVAQPAAARPAAARPARPAPAVPLVQPAAAPAVQPAVTPSPESPLPRAGGNQLDEIL